MSDAAIIFGGIVGIIVMLTFINYRQIKYTSKTDDLLNEILKELKQMNNGDH
ncbi:hypothetical protein [Neobacillus vireti]|uniref:hypothetical protein n=1 Tax=Neobacillus vireti TaxID=220686 RepID=UPI0003FCB040|nr:hypothetical protein [Neobacillus vireti]